MSTQNLLQNISGFTAGLNTERSALNILPTEMADGSINFEIRPDGSVRPRRGIDFVEDAELQTTRTSTIDVDSEQECVTGIFCRFNVDVNAGAVDRIIIFQDLKFKVFDPTDLVDFSTPLQVLDPDVDAHVAARQLFLSVEFKFGDNKIFFTGQGLQPGYLSVDETNGDVIMNFVEVRTREPETIVAPGDKVKNGGKYYECIKGHTSSAGDQPGVGANWLEYWKELDVSYVPVTAVGWVVSTGYSSGALLRVVHNNIYYECVFAHTSGASTEPGVGVDWENYWLELDAGIQPLNATLWVTATDYQTTVTRRFRRDLDVEGKRRPKTVEYWKGRLWLAGSDNGDSERVFYSQVADRNAKYSSFMTAADPRDSDDPDPVESDGGYLKVFDGTILQILGVGESLFVGTNRGIYEVTGQDGQEFKHTSYRVKRILKEGINGAENMVEADGDVYFFTRNNIWKTAGRDSTLIEQDLLLSAVGDDKIQTYYDRIPRINKGTARAVFNPSTRKLYYFHNGTISPFDELWRPQAGQNGYARNILTIDIRKRKEQSDQITQVEGAFELWEYADTAAEGDPYIAGAFVLPGLNTGKLEVIAGLDDVYANTDRVIIPATSGGNVKAEEILVISLARQVSGTTVVTKGAFAQLETTNLYDWNSSDTYRSSYTTKIFAGIQTMGDALHKKVNRYLYFVFERMATGVASCFLKTGYNWVQMDTNDPKVSDSTQIYKETRVVGNVVKSMQNFAHAWYKHRVRGRGNSFQILIQSEPGKDFNLIGWSGQFFGKVD